MQLYSIITKHHVYNIPTKFNIVSVPKTSMEETTPE